MSSLYFPLASFVVSLLLVIIFNNKQHQENKDTKVYSRMLIINIFETVTAISIIIIAKTVGTINLVYLLDRVDFILISLWCSKLFEYVYNVSIKKKNSNFNNIMFLVNILIIMILLISNFGIINQGDSIDTTGLGPMLVGLFCGGFAVAMLICLCINYFSDEKAKISKYYPLFVFIVLISLALVLRKYWPTMVLEPFMISFIDLIMFFTIENPDLKMIEELTLAKEQAEKYSNDKASFLFNMSQNVRIPLNSIEQMSDEIDKLDNIDAIKEKNDNIKLSLQRLKYIVNESLDISTIEVKNLQIIESEYDLRKIIDQISIKVNSQIKDKDIVFHTNISEALPNTFYGDAIRIKQILSTLLFNAAKHTEKGFIELDINSIIKHNVCRLIIKVEDSGVGIKAKEINKLFEKHDIEECSTDSATLRLDTLKKMINYIGGTIMVKKKKKKGTQFTVVLDQKIPDTEKTIENYIVSKPKFLIINDDIEVSKQLKRSIDKDSYEIVYTAGGEEALNNIRSGEKYNLVILNSKLDKLNAQTTFDRIQELNENKLPVILIDSGSNSVSKLSVSELVYIVDKPITHKKIDDILKNIKL